jgi:hypothetical protein
VSSVVNSHSVRFEQRIGITTVCFYTPIPLAVHRREVRVRYHHLVPEPLQVLSHPLRLRARLDQHSASITPLEKTIQTPTVESEPLQLLPPVRPELAKHTVRTTQIYGNMLHG